jgi:hypothetical protein
LERLARATGGVERLNLADVWKDIPRQPRFVSAAPYLLLAAVIVFLLEVTERRTVLLSSFWFRLRLPRRTPGTPDRRRTMTQPARGQPAIAGKSATSEGVASKGAAQTPLLPEELPAESATKPAHEPTKESADSGMLDALAHAQQRARKRTERK